MPIDRTDQEATVQVRSSQKDYHNFGTVATMRRRMGVSRLKKKQEADKRFAAAAKKLEASDLEHVTKLMAKFKVCQNSVCHGCSFHFASLNKYHQTNLQKDLEKFALENKDQIRKNPQFRLEFQRMCSSIGVDPLVSNKGKRRHFDACKQTSSTINNPRLLQDSGHPCSEV